MPWYSLSIGNARRAYQADDCDAAVTLCIGTDWQWDKSVAGVTRAKRNGQPGHISYYVVQHITAEEARIIKEIG